MRKTMNDLVKRLRKRGKEWRSGMIAGPRVVCIEDEAADEIERLKRELYKCKIEAKTIVDFNDELQQRIAELTAKR